MVYDEAHVVVFLTGVPADELVQQPSSDAALLRVWGVRASPGGGCRVDGLLAAYGGGHRAAAEPDHGGEDGAAFRTLEDLLHSRLEKKEGSHIHAVMASLSREPAVQSLDLSEKVLFMAGTITTFTSSLSSLRCREGEMCCSRILQ